MLSVSGRVAHALAIASDAARRTEVCGFLIGIPRGGLPFATELLLSQAATAQDSFELSEFELRRAQAWAEERGLRIVALFHSHPSGDPALSAEDRASLAHSPWPWVIVTRRRGGTALTGYAPRTGHPMTVRVGPARRRAGPTAEA